MARPIPRLSPLAPTGSFSTTKTRAPHPPPPPQQQQQPRLRQRRNPTKCRAMPLLALALCTVFFLTTWVLWGVYQMILFPHHHYSAKENYSLPTTGTAISAPNTTTTTTTKATNANKKKNEWILPPDRFRRYLVFYYYNDHQGAGNIAHGLLSAQLLGLEFHRTVCVVWPDFFQAFDYRNDHDHNHDSTVSSASSSSSSSLVASSSLCAGAHNWSRHFQFNLWNFAPTPPDECQLRDILASPSYPVVGMVGNTYPGWRTEIPPNFFDQHYRPKPELQRLLPWRYRQKNTETDTDIENEKSLLSSPPQVVVHLRAPDGDEDGEADRGLDDESLEYLGNVLLPGNGTYLVTNRPDWYEKFHTCCGWLYDLQWHPDAAIQHGGKDLTWFGNGQRKRFAKDGDDKVEKKRQNLKVWSDWYTMLHAKRLYHSPSDFSGSACHWNADCQGRELHGMITTRSLQRAPASSSSSGGGANTAEQQQFMTTAQFQPVTTRELELRPAPHDAVRHRIPPVVERLRPNKFFHDPTCQYLRFCTVIYKKQT